MLKPMVTDQLRFSVLPKSAQERSITPRIARRGVESSERLGRHRWVVELTLSWLNRFRRLTGRYERRADIHQALLYLGRPDLLKLGAAVLLGAAL